MVLTLGPCHFALVKKQWDRTSYENSINQTASDITLKTFEFGAMRGKALVSHLHFKDLKVCGPG
jgi:hypothetical protein